MTDNHHLTQALAVLQDPDSRVGVAAWPGQLEDIYYPGLYSWWVDDQGARILADGLDAEIRPGLIYVGQTGAARFGRNSQATLADRIGSSHVVGPSRQSTLRQTLFAAMCDRLGLEVESHRRLSARSEAALSAWMCSHLSVAVYPVSDRDLIENLERHIIEILDPPLNLKGVVSSPIRDALRTRRRAFGAGARPEPAAQPGEIQAPPSAQSIFAAKVTLHEELQAILRVLRNEWTTTDELAELVDERGRYRKRDGSPMTAFQIHGRTRKYDKLFERRGSDVRLRI